MKLHIAPENVKMQNVSLPPTSQPMFYPYFADVSCAAFKLWIM